jgi:hypothetical protein
MFSGRLLLPFAATSIPFASSAATLRCPAIAIGRGYRSAISLTGTGGGIFLSPLLLFMGWAETRQSSGLLAAFILVNSFAACSAMFPASARCQVRFSPWRQRQ